MRWTILTYFLLLLICYTCKSFADGSNSPSLDTSISGNYHINNCQHVEHSDDAHRLLGQFRRAVPFIISDLEKGTSSNHGFRTFFKSNVNIPIIKRVFTAMLQGTNSTVGKPPVLECMSAEIMPDELLGMYRSLCTPPRRGPTHAASLPSVGTIVICPRFWEERDRPHVGDCTGVVGRRASRKFADNGRDLRDTKFSILVHELSHLYNTLDGAAKSPEVYGAQGCVDLNARESVANAGNWALYAACEFSTLLSNIFSFRQLCHRIKPFHYLVVALQCADSNV
ncbi:MAG: hypothetical protein Q9169_002740 [Polycauliona sp. 2 TL-2023]